MTRARLALRMKPSANPGGGNAQRRGAKDRLNAALVRVLAGDQSAAYDAEVAQRELAELHHDEGHDEGHDKGK